MQMEPAPPQDYRTWLSQELLARIRQNPAYSLRRFAQQLGLSAATLSGILSGKRPLTLRSAHRIVAKLALSPAQAQQFLQLVVQGHAASAARPPEFMRLSAEAFQVISEWYNYAILELTFVPGCRADARWIAKCLGISQLEAGAALARLTELGLLEVRNGKPVKTTRHLATSDGVASAAIRKRHEQILTKAQASLHTHDVQERDFTSMTMAIDSSRLPEAKRRIAAFRRELCVFLEAGAPDRVYEFSAQLFPLCEPSPHRKDPEV